MNRRISIISILICIFMVMAFSSCTNSEIENAISFNVDKLELNVNEETRLELLSDDLIIVDGIEWKSMNDKIATVKDGVVLARSVGNTIISASYKGKTYNCEINVKEDFVILSENAIVVEINESHNLYIKLNGEIVEKGVTWKNSDNEVISMDNGKVTGLKLGESTISARYGDHAFICNVTVIEPFEVVGKFYSRFYVEEMDVTFEFDIEFKSDGTYKYSRRDNDLAQGQEINEGTWNKRNGMIVCLYEDGEMRFKGDKDKIASVGVIDTGGMVNVELTFDRVK